MITPRGWLSSRVVVVVVVVVEVDQVTRFGGVGRRRSFVYMVSIGRSGGRVVFRCSAAVVGREGIEGMVVSKESMKAKNGYVEV